MGASKPPCNLQSNFADGRTCGEVSTSPTFYVLISQEIYFHHLVHLLNIFLGVVSGVHDFF